MTTLREQYEDLERRILGPGAQLSSASKGRQNLEAPCLVRTEYQRDRDRIIHSKAFRRLKHKTQVFISPEGDHFRTRLTHTLEVAQISRTVARALRLNEDLVEAIALGHDLGHTPFGHAGEEVLQQLLPCGFRHNEQSLRVVDKLEGGQGLNLTWEVRDGILCHTGSQLPQTMEGQVVRICDRVAYINHDIDDALRAGVITSGALPGECLKILGDTHRDRINTMVLDLILTSTGKDRIEMSAEVQRATDELRDFLFDHVYIGSLAKREEGKAKRLVAELFNYYTTCPEQLPHFNQNQEKNTQRLVVDYIAGMTDNYATQLYLELFVPSGFKQTGPKNSCNS